MEDESDTSKSSSLKWVPGMSSKEVKARAKELRKVNTQRAEQRSKRQAAKASSQAGRGGSADLESTGADANAPEASTPGSNDGATKGGESDPQPSGGRGGRPESSGGGSADHRSGGSSTNRRELKRLIGRLEYGGEGGLGGVHVVVMERAAVQPHRKSGAGAWSEKVGPGGSRPLS